MTSMTGASRLAGAKGDGPCGKVGGVMCGAAGAQG